MAVNEIMAGRYNAVLHKLLQIGSGAPAPILAPEVIAAIVLEADRPEWLFLGGMQAGMGMGYAPAQVAARSILTLENPSGSGALVTIEKMWGFVATGEYMLMDRCTTADTVGYTPLAVTRVLDGRLADQPTVAIMQRTAAALPTGTFARLIDGGDGTYSFFKLDNPLIVLAPGTAIRVAGSADNSPIYVNFLWRERVLEQSETR